MIKKDRNILISLICAFCLVLITPTEVTAKTLEAEIELNPNSIIITDEINQKIDYVDSAFEKDTETILQNTINQEITDRIDVCKVNTEVFNTVDSINSSVNDLAEQKKENDAAIEAAKSSDEDKSQTTLSEYSEDEIYLLAAIIHCEARGEPYEGQVAVGAVVLNRVKSDDFPDTIKEVIYQSGQFTPAGNGTLDEVLINENVNSSCLSAAKDAIEGSNPIGDCLFFRTLNGSSGLEIGNHVFR